MFSLNSISFLLTFHLPVGLQAAESALGIFPGSSEAFRAVASEPGIVSWLSAAEPVATGLLQPVTAGAVQPPLGLLGPQAVKMDKTRLERHVSL